MVKEVLVYRYIVDVNRYINKIFFKGGYVCLIKGKYLLVRFKDF